MTKSTKFALIVFCLLVVLFFLNRRAQANLTIEGTGIFSGNNDEVFRFLIINGTDSLELTRNDSTWTISQADTLIIKNNQIEKYAESIRFRRVIRLKRWRISKLTEKWIGVGVNSHNFNISVAADFLRERREVRRDYATLLTKDRWRKLAVANDFSREF